MFSSIKTATLFTSDSKNGVLIMIFCCRTAMEARPVQRSGSRELSSNLARTSSIPSTQKPSAAEDSFIRSENNTQLMSRHLGQSYHLLSSSNGGAVGHICSSSSSGGFSNNLHYSTMVSHEKQHYAGSSSHAAQTPSNDSSWCHDSLPGGFLDFHENNNPAIQNNSQIEDGGIAAAFDDIQKRSDWHEWADHLITDEDPLMSTNWNDLLLETSSNSDSKVVKISFFEVFTFFYLISVFSCCSKLVGHTVLGPEITANSATSDCSAATFSVCGIATC